MDSIDICDMDQRARDFARNHELTCSVPVNAKGMCHAMSKLFCSLHPAASMVFLAGFRGDVSRSMWKNHSPAQYHHVVVNLDGIYYDFTARQYNPDVWFPRALTHDELAAEWEEIRA